MCSIYVTGVLITLELVHSKKAILLLCITLTIIYYFGSSRSTIPLSAQMLILLTTFFLIVAYHARLVEVTSRLDFLWKQQAEWEVVDMEETRHNNTLLLKNILPDHVASHFLKNERSSGDVRIKKRFF